jgi:hypothetical protein
MTLSRNSFSLCAILVKKHRDKLTRKTFAIDQKKVTDHDRCGWLKQPTSAPWIQAALASRASVLPLPAGCRHCEERSDVAIHLSPRLCMD